MIQKGTRETANRITISNPLPLPPSDGSIKQSWRKNISQCWRKKKKSHFQQASGWQRTMLSSPWRIKHEITDNVLKISLLHMSLLVHSLHIQPFFPRENRMSIKQFDPCKINGSKLSHQDKGPVLYPARLMVKPRKRFLRIKFWKSRSGFLNMQQSLLIHADSLETSTLFDPEILLSPICSILYCLSEWSINSMRARTMFYPFVQIY